MRPDHYQKATELLHDIGVAKMVAKALSIDVNFDADKISALKDLTGIVTDYVKDTPFLRDRIHSMLSELRIVIEQDRKVLQQKFDDL